MQYNISNIFKIECSFNLILLEKKTKADHKEMLIRILS